jgi:protein O-GlcNAc transferase
VAIQSSEQGKGDNFFMQTEQPDLLLQLAEKAYFDKDYTSAEQYLKEALAYYPGSAELHSNLGLILQRTEKLDEAIEYFRKAIRLDPNLADAHYNLGNALQTEGNLDEAKDSYQKALELDPGLPNVSYNLGTVYKELKQYERAAFYFRRALESDPDSSEAFSSLGTVLAEDGYNDEALGYFRKAIVINQKNTNAYLGLAAVFQRKRNFEKAIEYYSHALLMDPQNPDIYFNLGLIYREKWELDRAMECLQRAAQLRENDPNVYYHMGAVQELQGRFDLAAESYKKALRMQKDFVDVYQGLIMLMNYTGTYSPEEIFKAHAQFAETFEKPFASSAVPMSRKRLTGNRVRLGYFSPDFRRHSVAYFIEPILMSHTRKDFEVFCYSNVKTPDSVTQRIQSFVEHWREMRELSDDEAIELIQKDEIDILIDLAGHTSGNRMLMFARKPAPMQVSWIGYPTTTGLSAMDYKIVDSYTDPPGMTEQYYTERLLRLPDSFLCYQPEKEVPEVSLAPSLKSGHITFGSFNNFAKMSLEVVGAWANIMKAVPDSRLLLKSHCFSDEGTRRYASELFARHGIEKERVELLLYEPSVQTHLSLYRRVDIGLDTFPYNGTTTTCEALWMGVPVLTLSGGTHASRVGMSLLSNIGLSELVALTEKEYMEAAIELANDTKRLQGLRKSLRDMMASSPLTNAKRFTADLESCYRIMWGKLCGTDSNTDIYGG